jgi:hypothetical protein
MKIFSPILKGTTTVAQGTTNLSGSFTGSLLGTAATASYADNFTVGGTLTAQTINVQTITSSIEFNTGSTRNGSSTANTHQFTGSVLMSGSLGIGTSSPAGIFAVNTGASNQIAFVNNATTNGTYNIISLNGTYSEGTNMSIQGGGVGDANLYVNSGYTSSTSGSIIFRSGGASAYTERMRITSTGNVGIGTNSPTWLLEVYKDTTSGTTGGYPAISVNNPNASGYSGIYLYKGATQKGALEYNNAAERFDIGGVSDMAFITNAAFRMRINSAGNVGIGTTSPTNKVETNIGTTANGGYNLSFNSSTVGSTWRIVNPNVNNNTEFGTLNNNDLVFLTAASERMRISSTGIVTKPSNPAFRAYYTTNGTWTLAGNDTFVFNATEYNIGSCYNTSNGRFTAPVAGVYQFNFYTILLGAYSNGEIWFQKNGADLTSGTHLHFSTSTSGVWSNVHYVTSAYLNSGDYVSFVNKAQTVNYHGDDWSSFSGYLVG